MTLNPETIARHNPDIEHLVNEHLGDRTNGDGSGESPIDAYPYGVEDGRIVRYQTVKENTTIIVPLCNFDAQIREEIVLDDGAETHREFVIEGRLDTKAMLPETRVMVARFPSMNWVGESWGRRAIVNAGNSTKDHLRVAIQKLSPNARDRHVFTHTGWRKIGSQWRYLSGSTTGKSDFEVDLGTELARYRMPPVAGDPVGAMKLSLSLLKVAPLRITAPLFAACFRAPLCGAYPQDLSIWLEGRTGSMKSTLAALFQCHFGDFSRVTLPGNWESTANQLERRAFLLKDSLFVIDEYVPTGLNRREIETKASRILRGQGNLSGRNRLKSDLTERPAFYPRGIIISTGEEHPSGQSLLARTIVIELSRDDIDIDLLTALQQQAGRFAHAMAGYIAWLAPQMDDMPRLLKETFLGTRARATTGNEHLRIPVAAAHLWLGVHSALTYAQEIAAIGSSEAAEILDDCWDAFIQIGKDQFSSFCSATFNVARNFLRWSQVASNLSALSCRAQKTILFLMILQRQMIEEVASTITRMSTEITFSCQTIWRPGSSYLAPIRGDPLKTGSYGQKKHWTAPFLPTRLEQIPQYS